MEDIKKELKEPTISTYLTELDTKLEVLHDITKAFAYQLLGEEGSLETEVKHSGSILKQLSHIRDKLNYNISKLKDCSKVL